MTRRRLTITIAVAITLGAVVLWSMLDRFQGSLDHSMADQNLDMSTSAGGKSSALVSIKLPEQLSANAQIGKRIFDVKCAACHATNAVGQDGVAPPLVHKIYEPSHHGEIAFIRAAQNGVRSHHWSFGNMPAIKGVTTGDVKMVTAYIRELQRANGIY